MKPLLILALALPLAAQIPISGAGGGGGGNTAFPATVSGATSGGVACFTSATTETSSGTLTGNLPVFGGGPGVCLSSGSRTGNTTTVVTGTGAYTNGHGLVIDVNGNVVDSGGVPSGGTGNAGFTVTTTFSATPTFTCPSSTAGTVGMFVLSTTLTANITSSTLSTCTGSASLSSDLAFVFVQDATGGRTVAMPTGFDGCFVNPAANQRTECIYSWDGTTGRLLANTNNAGYSAGQTIAAPGTPPAADFYYWVDSTTGKLSNMANNSATVFSTIQQITGTAAMGTAAIASGACATVVTVAATGVATTDVIKAGFNGDPTAVTGYGASGTGAVLTIYPYPTANNVNFKVCNNTGSSITPGALTLNWRVDK